MISSTQFSLAKAVRLSAMMVGVLLLVKAVEILLRLPLGQWGILPRTVAGLPGIIFSPLLHASLSHLAANAVPLFVLLVLLLSHRAYHPWRTLALIWGLSGLGTWLIGRGHAVHLGASSIIFGLAAFLIVAGFQMKSWRSAATASAVTSPSADAGCVVASATDRATPSKVSLRAEAKASRRKSFVCDPHCTARFGSALN